MKHLIETTDLSSLGNAKYDRLILDSTKNKIIYRGEVTYEYVDLGLPSGLKWAKCNIGATSETEDGVYFQWGDISGISGSLLGKYSNENYSWASYIHYNNSYNTLTKYCTNSSYGPVDNKTTLEPMDDAATQIMGGDWRMPTASEFQELYGNTTNEWFTNYNGTGVRGMKFTSKTNGKSIFFPASGFAAGTGVDHRGTYGKYWSSSLYQSRSSNGFHLRIYGGGIEPQYDDRRYFGFCVRGVRK